MPSAYHRVWSAADLVTVSAIGTGGRLAALLSPDFYADAGMMRRALQRALQEDERSTLITTLARSSSTYFPLPTTTTAVLNSGGLPGSNSTPLVRNRSSAPSRPSKDTIQRKLECYRAGGETSERPWNDMRGVLKVSGPRLDRDYMRRWAPVLKVDDLLELLRAE